MDHPLIFGYYLSGVKTLYMTWEVRSGAVLDVCVLYVVRRRGDPEVSEGEVSCNHLPRKV